MSFIEAAESRKTNFFVEVGRVGSDGERISVEDSDLLTVGEGWGQRSKQREALPSRVNTLLLLTDSM